jgi:hypothetical protein
MATVQAFIRESRKKTEKAIICFRLKDGRNIDLHYKSELKVNPDLWDIKTQQYKTRPLIEPKERASFNKSITDRKIKILEIYDSEVNKEGLTSSWLEKEIDRYLHPENYKPVEVINEEKPKTFFDVFEEYLNDRKHSTENKLSEGRMGHFKVVKRILQRYELYTAKKEKRPVKLTLDNITGDTLRDIDNFLRIEFTLLERMPELYIKVPETRKPQPRGQNTINGIMTKIRTFYLSSIDGGLTKNNPFKNITIERISNGKTIPTIIKGYNIGSCKYGTPYYISTEERKTLYKMDLSHRPHLEIQRDIFVFQCLVGCRVGDLYKFTNSNIIDNVIHYIPGKTKEENIDTVKVPLNVTAKEILSKYSSINSNLLFPFIAKQHYNEAIKESFKLAGLTRMITIVNPSTGITEQRPLNEIASSHLARRTFIGGLYNKVPDPNIIGSMTGHVENSKSFSRYREIDEGRKKNLVNLLD